MRGVIRPLAALAALLPPSAPLATLFTRLSSLCQLPEARSFLGMQYVQATIAAEGIERLTTMICPSLAERESLYLEGVGAPSSLRRSLWFSSVIARSAMRLQEILVCWVVLRCVSFSALWSLLLHASVFPPDTPVHMWARLIARDVDLSLDFAVTLLEELDLATDRNFVTEIITTAMQFEQEMIEGTPYLRWSSIITDVLCRHTSVGLAARYGFQHATILPTSRKLRRPKTRCWSSVRNGSCE